MSHRKWFGSARATALAVCLAFVVPATTAAEERVNREPIVGLWSITVSYGGSVIDTVFSGWTSDGLEFDQDTSSPILTGYICYGTWIKLGDHRYALTHPFFDYVPGAATWNVTAGTWDGTSGYFNYVVTVSDDGKTFTGEENGMSEVPGPNPYVGAGTAFSGITLSATKIKVNESLLPQL
jgi:hypothetical protein